MMRPFISLCIPTRNKPALLRKLLHSIAAQTYKDYEILVTDNSDNQLTKELVENEFNYLQIRYHKNDPVTNMPENWNVAFRMAKGEWLKMIHDDDWFTDETCLDQFAQAAKALDKGVLFSGCIYVEEAINRQQLYICTNSGLNKVRRQPFKIFINNVLGNPSCMLIHHTYTGLFDYKLQWFVDIDFYYFLLKNKVPLHYLPAPLLSIAVNNSQMTASVKNDPRIQLFETGVYLEKIGYGNLRNIWLYDSIWRMLRNLNINSMEFVEEYSRIKNPSLLSVIKCMISVQKKLPPIIRKNGFLSKFGMIISYAANKKDLAAL